MQLASYLAPFRVFLLLQLLCTHTISVQLQRHHQEMPDGTDSIKLFVVRRHKNTCSNVQSPTLALHCTALHWHLHSILFRYDHVPLHNPAAGDDAVLHVRVVGDHGLGGLVVGEDEERSGRDLHVLRTGGAARETSALLDEALGQAEVSLAMRAALLQDVGDVVVLEQVLSGTEGGGGR